MTNEIKCLYKPGIRHRVIQDDVYNGYFIPKGTIVIANIWYVCSVKFIPWNIPQTN